jgi:hypothetical protein
MKRNTYNYRQGGTPANGTEETYAFALERYHDLLREAEDYRIAQELRPLPLANGQSALPWAHLLDWAKVQLTALTHAA